MIKRWVVTSRSGIDRDRIEVAGTGRIKLIRKKRRIKSAKMRNVEGCGGVSWCGGGGGKQRQKEALLFGVEKGRVHPKSRQKSCL